MDVSEYLFLLQYALDNIKFFTLISHLKTAKPWIKLDDHVYTIKLNLSLSEKINCSAPAPFDMTANNYCHVLLQFSFCLIAGINLNQNLLTRKRNGVPYSFIFRYSQHHPCVYVKTTCLLRANEMWYFLLLVQLVLISYFRPFYFVKISAFVFYKF